MVESGRPFQGPTLINRGLLCANLLLLFTAYSVFGPFQGGKDLKTLRHFSVDAFEQFLLLGG